MLATEGTRVPTVNAPPRPTLTAVVTKIYAAVVTIEICVSVASVVDPPEMYAVSVVFVEEGHPHIVLSNLFHRTFLEFIAALHPDYLTNHHGLLPPPFKHSPALSNWQAVYAPEREIMDRTKREITLALKMYYSLTRSLHVHALWCNLNHLAFDE